MKLIFLLIALFSTAALYAIEDADLLSFGVGVYSITDDKYMTAEFRCEYKFNYQFKKCRPLVGLMATAKGTVYAYTGLGLELIIYDQFIFSPNFAAGLYYKGGGRDLGYPLEFRSGLEVGWRFTNYCRLGLHFYHLSNASIGHKNPGEESLDLFFYFPLQWPTKKYK